MTPTKPKYLLIEHKRYFYQRKVPLEFQQAVGCKKWRAPLGDDIDVAYDRLKEIRSEHDALLRELKDPEMQRDYAAKQRRVREAEDRERIRKEDAAYDKWCRDNSVKTEEEEHQEFLELNELEEEPSWEKAERLRCP